MWRNNQYARKLHDACFELIYGSTKKIIPRTLNGPIVWPVYQRVIEKEKLNHFCSYQENIFKQPVNSKNALFVVGPQQSGKSWFIKNTCKNALIIDNNYINFDSFLQQMKNSIINFICEKNLLTIDELQQIALDKYPSQYLDIYVNQYIRDRLDQSQKLKLIKTNNQISLPNLDWDTGELEFWQEDAQQIQQQSSNSYAFSDYFVSLGMIEGNQSSNKNSLDLMLNIIQQMEIDKISNPCHISSTTAAQQQIDFLFDILNFVSGYSKNATKKSEIALVLLNTDKLFEYYRYDAEALDFFDHLILRTYNQQGIRNHFPVIIESSNSKFYNRDMMEMMNIELNTVLHLDVLDIPKEQIKIQIEGIFSQEEIDQIYNVIGGSLKLWHQFTKNAVSNSEFQLEHTLKQLQSVEQIKFNYLMNITTLNNELSELLDNQQIDGQIYRIMHALNYFKGVMYTGTYYADTILMENSVVHALQQEGVLYHPKYISHLFFSKRVFNSCCQKYLERKKKLIKVVEEEDEDLLVSAFKLERKQRGEFLKQNAEEPRKYLYDDIRKEERPYHEQKIIFIKRMYENDNTDTADSHHKNEELFEELQKYWRLVVSHMGNEYHHLLKLSNESDALELVQSLCILEEKRDSEIRAFLHNELCQEFRQFKEQICQQQSYLEEKTQLIFELQKQNLFLQTQNQELLHLLMQKEEENGKKINQLQKDLRESNFVRVSSRVPSSIQSVRQSVQRYSQSNKSSPQPREFRQLSSYFQRLQCKLTKVQGTHQNLNNSTIVLS